MTFFKKVFTPKQRIAFWVSYVTFMILCMFQFLHFLGESKYPLSTKTMRIFDGGS